MLRHDLIQIGNKPVSYKTWKNAGINKIQHILDTEGKIRSKQNIELKYTINIKQQDYNGLMHSIPKQWLKTVQTNTDLLALQNDNLCKIQIDKRYVKVEDISTKEIYKYTLSKANIKIPTGKGRWIE